MHTHKVRWSIVAMLAALGCGTTSVAPDGGSGAVEVVRSSRARITATNVSDDDVATLSTGNRDFGVALYRAVGATPGNVVLSPQSVSIALGMTWAGARADTETAMAGALRFTMGQARTHAAFNALDQALASREQQRVESGRTFRLRVANSLWGQRGATFLPTFLDTLALNYGAGMNLVDFVRDTEAARLAINGWVSDRTERRIPELIARGVLDPSTRLVLTNAVYFNASWRDRFDAARTSPEAFTRLDGSTVSPPTMRQSARLDYAEGDGWQAVSMPYVGEQVSMLFILPAAGRFAEVEASMDGARLANIAGALRDHDVNLTLPRFSFRTAVSLRQQLTALGMAVAFTDAADLSGINGLRNLYVQDVVHQGFIAVDENGTEAAAATAVVVGVVSVPPPATFHANRPFLFAIRDEPTGAVVFLGRVVDPTQ